MILQSLLKFSAALLFTLVLAACDQSFSTSYDSGVDPAVARNWRLGQVVVTVPASLVVNEEDVLIPNGDIVWHGDPPGDRKAQVARIMTDAVTAGARHLRGSERVNILVELVRFHALSPSAAALNYSGVGVHNVDFYISVVDARSGKVLVAKELIQAALPAYTGDMETLAVSKGETQKKRISDHVRDTVAGWLGIGPDARRTFERIGA